jgi:hypothetical protein
MTPEEIAEIYPAFRSDVEAAMDRYLDRRVDEMDWDQFEAEARILIAAHFPPEARFQAVITFDITWGPPISVLLTNDDIVRYDPYD